MDIDDVSRVLGALSQPTRYEIMQLLSKDVQAGGTGLPAGVIAERLGIQPATLSFHLKDMTLKGILSQRREGRNLIYTADMAALIGVLEFVVADICGG